jgi:predicted outer membrane repeat protein
MLAPITVNSHLDNTIFGDGLITLREAIIAANETIEHDTIDFAHGLNGATIRLQYFGQQNAALSIGRDVTIDATMLPLGITLDALDTEIDPTIPGDQDGLRIFDIGGAETFNLSVTLAGLKLTGGNPIFGGPGAIAYQAETGMLTIRDCKIVGNFGFGAGAISASVGSTGTTNGVRIERTEISGNTSVSGQTYGAGIFASVRNGSFDIIDSTISGNEGLGSFSKGGGVYGRLEGNSTMTIDRTVISDNTTYGQGGGFFVLLAGPDNGKFVLSDSTVSGNHALHNVGGGGYVCQKFGGEFEAINSTISGNDALHATYGRGGGLAIARETNAPAIDSHLDHLTITNNKATSGGGLYSTDDALVHTYVNHTIISGNRNAAGQPNNVGGDIENDSSYNLLGSGGSADISPQTLGPGNTFDDDPKLGPLTNNGGPTLTHMPQFGSLAIDAGDPNALAGQNGVPTYDQRGAPHNRVVNLLEAENGPANETNVIDIGAVEVKRPSDPLYPSHCRTKTQM